MNWKKWKIYGFSIALIMYQTSMGMSANTMAAPADSVSLIRDKADGVYQAEIHYDKYMRENPNCVHPAKEWKKINGKYQYPVTPYDKEWGNYMLSSERNAACQIPQKILDELSTEELLELVLDCPLIISMSLHDTIVEGVKILAQEFNGMHELLSREDCLSVVSRYYAEYKIPEKQLLDYDALLGDPDKPDYDAIVDHKDRMRKADQDAKVMHILNLCEAVMEIASEENRMSRQETQAVTKLILQKSKEKMKSECVGGASVEEDQEDSILNQYRQQFAISASTKTAGTDGSRNLLADLGSFQLPDGGTVHYTTSRNSGAVTQAEISQSLNYYSQYYLTSGGKAVTLVGNGGTTAYNCYNFAWLKKYDPENLWKKCTLNDDKAFRNYKYFNHRSSPGGAGWIGSNGTHAVYCVKKEVSYRNERGNVLSEPLVKSKWGAEGPLIQHPVALCKCYDITSESDLTWYC